MPLIQFRQTSAMLASSSLKAFLRSRACPGAKSRLRMRQFEGYYSAAKRTNGHRPDGPSPLPCRKAVEFPFKLFVAA
jgi:hypothetical protein